MLRGYRRYLVVDANAVRDRLSKGDGWAREVACRRMPAEVSAIPPNTIRSVENRPKRCGNSGLSHHRSADNASRGDSDEHQ